MELRFEVLCIDQKGKVKFSDDARLLDALSINESLWIGNLQRDYALRTLTDEEQQLKIKLDGIDTSKVVADLFTSAFIVTAEGPFDKLEPFRIKLIEHLRYLEFNHIRILTCDVSKEISLKTYPLINKIENLLRRYIIKFFITKIGLGWFDISVSTEVKAKVKLRKENEPVFTKSSLVNTDVTLIDFNELGEIITRQTSVYSKAEDVIDKINSAASLEELKNEVTGHYPKYFKSIFEKHKFETKWKTLFEIRNRVAHNNYLMQSDFEDAQELYNELEVIITEAEEKIDEAVLTVTEKQAINKAIQESVIEQQNYQSEVANIEKQENIIQVSNEILPSEQENILRASTLAILTEELFIDELRKLKNKNPQWKFVALSKLFDFLEVKGYNRHSIATLASILKDKKKVEIEYIDNPINLNKTATIKVKD